MNNPLRGCPLCKTPVRDTKLGLRDYRWLEDVLPGKEAPMDMDAVLEKHGKFLGMEFKAPGEVIPLGQRITLKTLVRQGWCIWVVYHEDGSKSCEVGQMDRHGNVPFKEVMSIDKLKQRVAEWLKLEREDRAG